MLRLLTIFVATLVAGPATAEEAPPMPKPIAKGAEHAFAKSGAGTWKVVQKFWMDPSKPPVEATGKLVAETVLDGLGLAYEYTADKHGEAPQFRGYGFTTWIPAKKHYEGFWFDIYSFAGMSRSTGTWDEKNKTLTEVMVGPDHTGKDTTFTVKTVYASEDQHTSSFFHHRGDQQVKTMELHYTRAKQGPVQQ